MIITFTGDEYYLDPDVIAYEYSDEDLIDMMTESMSDFMDEFSANMFVIDFINNKLQEVEELWNILAEHYEAMYADGGIWDYIENKEVA